MADPLPIPEPYALSAETPARLPITTIRELFEWYRVNLCGQELVDPRGYRVHFLDTDFVHLIKLTNKYGTEPRNVRLAIEQIQSGRIVLNPERMSIQRAHELSWARQIITSPDKIVPNWQPTGRANPGMLTSRISVKKEAGMYIESSSADMWGSKDEPLRSSL